MKRSKHTLSHYRMVTGNMGTIMPIQCVPVLPGDTMQGNTNALIRVSPLNTPVMHPVTVRMHTFYCPNRIVMPEWEDFITGGIDGMDATAIPTSVMNTTKDNMPAYLGVPPINGVNYNNLALQCANKILNEYYLDQDLETPRTATQTGMAQCAWEKDYFTTARPWSQKGPDVTIPLGTTAPVTSDAADLASIGVTSSVKPGASHIRDSGANLQMLFSGTPSDTLYADLSNATAASVNDWRAAFALQRYQEARARYGARFTEYLQYLGITPSDQRLQRPEYLSGGTARLNFSEVLQTAGTTDGSGDGVGDLFGHGIAGAGTGRWRKFFQEHGYVITFLSVRPKAIYMNGLHREYLKTTKEDFFQKELANLGQQEVYEAELYAENARDVFGYQDRYEEYRHHPSQVSQDFRDLLNSWHLARELSANPTLNASFIQCSPSNRIFQDTGATDKLWIMANNHLVARRLVPKRARPRIL